MSLRWKLLRFLTAETILPAEESGGDASTVDVDGSAAMAGFFFGLGGQANPQSAQPQDTLNHQTELPSLDPTYRHLLRQLVHATGRSSSKHAAAGVYVFGLPRGAVEVFDFGPDGIRVGPRPADAQLPGHFTIVAHASLVSAVHVVPRQEPYSPVVVTAGLDTRVVSVKLWAFSSAPIGTIGSPSRFLQDPVLARGDQTKILTCSATLRLQTDSLPSAIAVHDGGVSGAIQCVALGLEDGAVMIISGDLLRERFTRIRVPPAAGEMPNARPVRFITFAGPVILCITEQSVAVVRPVHDAGVVAPAQWGDLPTPKSYKREPHDSRGILEHGAATYLPYSEEIVVAREEGLYFFHKDGRGSCLAFPSEGSNTCIAALSSYVIHSTSPKLLVAYDLASKVLAYRATTDVLAMFADESSRSVLIIVEDGSIVRLKEVPLETRVRMLLSRGLHSSAITLAKAEGGLSSQGAPSSMFTDAVREYALFLMAKGDYDTAASQLTTTIGGTVESSWVITRLVQQPGLRSGLRIYLEALHLAGKAEFVHTRVLITCYRHDRARAAILGSKREEKTTDAHIVQVLSSVEWSEAEVDTSIDVCCEAGLYSVAESVARKRGRNVRLARTLVDHLDDIEGGLSLMRSLKDRGEAFEIAQACGRKLLARAPKEFVAITANLTSGIEGPTVGLTVLTDSMAALSEFARVFVDRPQWFATLIESILNNRSSSPGIARYGSAVWMMLFEALARADVDRAPRAPIGRSALKVLQSRTAKIDLTKALLIGEMYGHGPCLEYVYEHLRMYKELGQHLRWSSDVNGLLRACRRHGKREPLLWLEAVRLISPLASAEILRKSALRGRLGKSEQLSNAASQSRVLDSSVSVLNGRLDMLQESMYALDSSGILSPAQIVDIICGACPDGGWQIIQQYFEKTIGVLTSRALEKEAMSKTLTEEAQETKGESARLCEAVIINSRVCGICEDELNLPSVHFFCGHSFHVPCIMPSSTSPMLHVTRPESHVQNDLFAIATNVMTGAAGEVAYDEHIYDAGLWTEAECPRCAPELDAIVSMRNALEEKNLRHDDFFRYLRGSSPRDGFETIIGSLVRSAFL